MKKKFFIMLALTLAILLSACGGKDDSEQSVGNEPNADLVNLCGDRGVKSYNSATGALVCGDAVSANQPAQPSGETSNQDGEEVDDPDCPPARELGPWAPNNGLGEDFEVTANETVSTGVHIQLWWPAGSSQDWDKQEISTYLPPGLSVEAQDGAGRGWEYGLGCSIEFINEQMEADAQRRETDTSYYGQVDIDDLIETGLVVVRFDRR